MKRLIASKQYEIDNNKQWSQISDQLWEIVSENLDVYFDKFYYELQDVKTDGDLETISIEMTRTFVGDHPELEEYEKDLSDIFFDQLYAEMEERGYDMWNKK